ncbi:GNAT family N-acetyltransferase [Symbiobacterium thermophilum]|uniref:GNAT family N-acetyltransferase n=1 Tax=Symbiobacterium thermophilum TaxID=2734 RepID=A0A953LIF0_SYMTR|nr:GNAT family N-acetyltransferase [Symbiobacterium thermophilum]MBY6277191.1 GNAT family N-acetyltransferase [Symbiobacterium thermophilum]
MAIRTVRVTTPEQLEAAFAIRRKVFIEEQNVPPEEELDGLDRTAAHVLALDPAGRPVATGRIIPYGEGTGKLQRIAVLPEFRGQGYGRAVVGALEEMGRAMGFRRFVLGAQTHAEPFYRRLGYRTTSPEVFLDAGIPHVHMEKVLED